MPDRHFIFLVPGFFGFVNLGEIVYFRHLRDFLLSQMNRLELTGDVISVCCHPTASLQTRARELWLTMKESGAGESDSLHIIGHSSGALDARLFLSPNGPSEYEAYASRVKTLVSVSAPHFGTPLASFFMGVFGPQLLKILSLFTAAGLRRGHLPLSILFKMADAFTRTDRLLGWKRGVLDDIFGQLLSDFSAERQVALTAFFSQVSADQSLIPELSPSAMADFNAKTPMRPGVRIGSVVTRSPPPSLRSRLAVGLDPYGQLTQTLYAFLYRNAQGLRQSDSGRVAEYQRTLLQAYRTWPSLDDSDGVVPTHSQPFGHLIAAVRADHLDAIGHFEDLRSSPPHIDWLTSGAGFSRMHFEHLWHRVLRFILSRKLSA